MSAGREEAAGAAGKRSGACSRGWWARAPLRERQAGPPPLEKVKRLADGGVGRGRVPGGHGLPEERRRGDRERRVVERLAAAPAVGRGFVWFARSQRQPAPPQNAHRRGDDPGQQAEEGIPRARGVAPPTRALKTSTSRPRPSAPRTRPSAPADMAAPYPSTAARRNAGLLRRRWRRQTSPSLTRRPSPARLEFWGEEVGAVGGGAPVSGGGGASFAAPRPV